MKSSISTSPALAIGYFVTAIWLICLVSEANAHEASTGYLNINKSAAQVNNGQIQLPWSDLEIILAIQDSTTKQLLLDEVRSQQSAVIAYLKEHLQFRDNQARCEINFTTPLQIAEHYSEHYAVANFSWSCPVDSSQLTIHYSGIFQLDDTHRLLINAETGGNFISGIVESGNTTFVVDFSQAVIWKTFTLYVYQGVLHIFVGIDHILFLIALLLTCALTRKEQRWTATTDIKSVFKNAAWIVTAFTLAHSLTLTATAMELITPNSRWVEFGIAISVLLTALNNIWPVILRLGWITFAFGLLHGMGFAGVLGELGLAQNQKLLSVLSFNLGVELGQVMILIVALPPLILASNRFWYQQYAVKVGSAMIALVALSWSLQRFWKHHQ